MKKSVIILIGVIYAVSIMLVTFYGLKTEEYIREQIPVTEIEISNEGIQKLGENQDKCIILNQQIPDGGHLEFQIEYELTPSDATNKDVVFEIDSEDSGFAEVDENGLVKIFGNKAISESSPYCVISVRIFSVTHEGETDTKITDKLLILYPRKI